MTWKDLRDTINDMEPEQLDSDIYLVFDGEVVPVIDTEILTEGLYYNKDGFMRMAHDESDILDPNSFADLHKVGEPGQVILIGEDSL